jgi:hypothetical protein
LICNTKIEAEARQAMDYLLKLIEKGKPVEIIQIKASRSKWQNKYWQAMSKAMADHIGYSHREMKRIIERSCCPVYESNGTKFLKETKDLDTKEFSDFIRDFQIWAAETHDYYVPDPNEPNEPGENQ